MFAEQYRKRILLGFLVNPLILKSLHHLTDNVPHFENFCFLLNFRSDCCYSIWVLLGRRAHAMKAWVEKEKGLIYELLLPIES